MWEVIDLSRDAIKGKKINFPDCPINEAISQLSREVGSNLEKCPQGDGEYRIFKVGRSAENLPENVSEEYDLRRALPKTS